MARIRTIKPEFWESESVGRLSFGARLLCIASLNLADDEGLLRWNEAFLMSQVFAYDDVLTEQISEWMRELVNESIIFPYKSSTSNQRLGWIVNFRTHQVINRPQPSKLPAPSLQNRDYQNAIFMRDHHVCHLCGERVNISDAPNISGSLAPSIDHLIPVSKGGSDHPSNLKTSHLSCNKSRGNRPVDSKQNDSLNGSLNDSVRKAVPERKGREGNGMEVTRAKKSDLGISEIVELGIDQSLARDFLALRAKKRAPLTKTALDGIMRESHKAGISLTEALQVCCEKGWQGFDADWYAKLGRSKTPTEGILDGIL